MKENKKIIKKEELEGIKNHYRELLLEETSNTLENLIDKKIFNQQKKVAKLKREILSIKKDVYLESIVESVMYK